MGWCYHLYPVHFLRAVYGSVGVLHWCIVTAVEGFKADPINSLAVGWGILKFICSAFVGWLSFGVGFGIGAGIVAKSGA